MKFYKKTLTLAAGVWTRIDVGGSQFLLSGGDDIDVELLDHRSPRGNMENVPQGIRFQVKGGFDAVRLKSDAGDTVTIYIADDEIGLEDVASAVTVSGPIPAPTVLDTTADDTVAATSSAQVLAANTSRVAAFVQLDAGAPGAVRVGDSNVGASRGLELQPGDSITIETTEAVHVYNPNGTGATVHLMETVE